MVAGPPCSGKSTLVREQMHHGDLAIDFDWIAAGLGVRVDHMVPADLVPIVNGIYTDLMVKLRAGHFDRLRAVWVIKCSPNSADMLLADELLIAPTSKAVCVARAKAQGREQRTIDFINAWTPPVR